MVLVVDDGVDQSAVFGVCAVLSDGFFSVLWVLSDVSDTYLVALLWLVDWSSREGVGDEVFFAFLPYEGEIVWYESLSEALESAVVDCWQVLFEDP